MFGVVIRFRSDKGQLNPQEVFGALGHLRVLLLDVAAADDTLPDSFLFFCDRGGEYLLWLITGLCVGVFSSDGQFHEVHFRLPSLRSGDLPRVLSLKDKSEIFRLCLLLFLLTAL